jgi:hypothetical protein
MGDTRKKTVKINNREKKEGRSGTRARKIIMMKRYGTTTNLIHVTSQTCSSLVSAALTVSTKQYSTA